MTQVIEDCQYYTAVSMAVGTTELGVRVLYSDGSGGFFLFVQLTAIAAIPSCDLPEASAARRNTFAESGCNSTRQSLVWRWGSELKGAVCFLLT